MKKLAFTFITFVSITQSTQAGNYALLAKAVLDLFVGVAGIMSEDTPKTRALSSEDVAKILLTYDPKIKPWTRQDYSQSVRQAYSFNKEQSLFKVNGDFDGDGEKDVVIQGSNGKEELVIAVLSATRKAHLVEKFPLLDPQKSWTIVPDLKNHSTKKEYGKTVYLEYVEQGKGENKLKHAAFRIVHHDKASILYNFDGANFLRHIISD